MVGSVAVRDARQVWIPTGGSASLGKGTISFVGLAAWTQRVG
jgi:hypothetical protein